MDIRRNALAAWTSKDGHGRYFYDTELDVQVGQAYQTSDGRWEIEVNDIRLAAPDLDTAIGHFLEKYDQSLVQLSLGSSYDGDKDSAGDFEKTNLEP